MYIKVRVVTDSKKEILEKIDHETYKIFTRAPAERGLANSRVIEMLAEVYPNQKLRIVSGHTSPSKIVSIG